MQFAVPLFPTIFMGILANMTKENSNKIKCEVCGFALPLNATICPHCGGNSILIQMIENIPRAGSSPQPVVFPAMVLQPKGNRGNAVHQVAPGRKQPAPPAGALEQIGAKTIGFHQVVLNRKQPAAPAQVLQPGSDKTNPLHQVMPNRKQSAAPARVLQPGVDNTNAVHQIMPNRKSPAVSARVSQPEREKTTMVHQVVPTSIVLPDPASASVRRGNLESNHGGIWLPQSGDSNVRNAPLKGSILFAARTAGTSVKRIFTRSPVASRPGTQQRAGYHGLLKEWILPTILITSLFFLFMEYVAKNYQARASGSTSLEPQSTMIALGERISQAEATISAQQNTIFALQNTIAVPQNPIITQEAIPTTNQIDLNKTLLLGPLDGSLIHSYDGLIKTYWAEQNTKNFILSFVLVNPYSSAFHPWDICIRFRRIYTNEYRLTIFSTHQWTLTYGLSTEPIARGTLTNLKTGEAESNLVYLEVRDGVASLKVNDVFVPAIDLSSYQDPGDVGIAIGTQKGDEVEGKTTVFNEFTLWNVP
jgi:hypothetical protein